MADPQFLIEVVLALPFLTIQQLACTKAASDRATGSILDKVGRHHVEVAPRVTPPPMRVVLAPA